MEPAREKINDSLLSSPLLCRVLDPPASLDKLGVFSGQAIEPMKRKDRTMNRIAVLGIFVGKREIVNCEFSKKEKNRKDIFSFSMTFLFSTWLILLIIGLLLLLSSIFFHIWWMVPFVPTPMIIVQTMVHLADIKKNDCVIDLGAGDARFLLEAQRKEPTVQCIGYEGSIIVWMLGKVRIWLDAKKSIDFHCANFFLSDLHNADIIFTYLSMQTMKKLLPKFQKELREGTKIVTHAFRIPELTPEKTIDVPMTFGGTTKAYLYVWKKMDAKGSSAQ